MSLLLISPRTYTIQAQIASPAANRCFLPEHPLASWWRPDHHADRRPFLLARDRIRRAFRSWFEARDFLEIEAAILQPSPGAETHLHAFATQAIDPAGRQSDLFLHTSPEFAAKKLLAAGETRIVDFARVFRNRERGPLHHPEFTLVEWYRAHADYQVLMDDCAALIGLAAEMGSGRGFQYRGRSCDPFAAPRRMTVADAFRRFAGIDLLASLDRGALAEAAGTAGVRVAVDDTWSDIFSRVLVEKVEPNLGLGRATILFEYPIAEAALARPSRSDGRVAERFELYACGVELANAYGELTDPVEQRRRFEQSMAEKARIYGQAYPIDEYLLAAMEHMPPASGAALGFDRLVMLASGAERIDQVIWTPLA